MKKRSYYVFDVVKNGKNYAYVEIIPHNYNLVGYLENKNDTKIISVNACDTKKEADAIAKSWNDIYIKKGVYLYQ